MWKIFKVDTCNDCLFVDHPSSLNNSNLWFLTTEWPVSGKTMAVVGTGVAAAVVATPLVIAGAGFTATGVAAGSLAAMFQV